MLLDYEGFDRETNLALSQWWDFGVGSGNVGADGTGALSYGRGCNVPYGNGRNIPATQTLWWQAHIYTAVVPGGDWAVKWNDSGASQCLFGFESDLRGKVWINGGSSASPSPIMAFNSWNFIQIKLHVAAVGGYYEIWVNGVLEHTFTGDTQITANAYVNQWALFNSGGEKFDNIIVYDEDPSSEPFARTLETRIYAEMVTGDESVAWTPSAGSNWQNVDEQPNDGDTSYNATLSLVDDVLTCQTSVPAGNTVYAVAVEFDARKDDPGTAILAPLIEVDGTSYEGDAAGLTTSYQRFRTIWTENPATGNLWTVAQANAANIGYRRTT